MRDPWILCVGRLLLMTHVNPDEHGPQTALPEKESQKRGSSVIRRFVGFWCIWEYTSFEPALAKGLWMQPTGSQAFSGQPRLTRMGPNGWTGVGGLPPNLQPPRCVVLLGQHFWVLKGTQKEIATISGVRSETSPLNE